MKGEIWSSYSAIFSEKFSKYVPNQVIASVKNRFSIA